MNDSLYTTSLSGDIAGKEKECGGMKHFPQFGVR
jgi:hypothetical protein